jgi:uncharacterized membrane protein YciS (DUF1049 family)
MKTLYKLFWFIAIAYCLGMALGWGYPGYAHYKAQMEKVSPRP